MNMLLIILLSLYLLFLILLLVGWLRASRPKIQKVQPRLKYSILIPFRNESQNLTHLLDSIKRLDFSKECFEVIFINDHSTDGFEPFLKSLKNSSVNIKCYHLENDEGKKAAIDLGIKNSTGDIIITTDADCLVPPNWLINLAYYFEYLGAKFAFGGVSLRGDNSIFSQLQQIEFASLIGSGATTLQLGLPSMCNGANLAYRKDAFYEVGGFSDNKNIASGDDEFLLHKIFSKYPKSVFYINSKDNVVTTQVAPSLRAFFNQRKRWASKWKYYKGWKNVLLAIIVFLFQVSIITSFIGLLFKYVTVSILYILAVKMLMEGLFLRSVCRQLGNKFHILPFIILQIGYPFYVVLFGLTANFGKYKWKGRKHRL